MHADIEVADLDLWASDTDDTSARTKSTAEKHECANLRVSGRNQGIQQVCVSMAFATRLMRLFSQNPRH